MLLKIFCACRGLQFCAVLVLFIFCEFIFCEGFAEAAHQSRMRITTASGIRVRTGPQVTAEEVTRLSVGAVLQELEASPNTEKIAGVEDRWYRVVLPDGKQGWVFGGFTLLFDAAKAGESYRQIANNRLKVEDPSFSDSVDLANFLARVKTEITRADLAAELELARLLAIKRAAAAIPADKQEEPQYQSWIKAQGDQLVYSEPAAQWFVNSDLFWQLQKKYGSLPAAERIAWEGANNALPGECEGFLDCNLYAYIRTVGRYLNLYPRGAHADEALNSLAEFFDEVIKSEGTYEVSDRGDLRKGMAELRAIIIKTSGPKKAAVLKAFDQVAARYR
jgi:hypothetical protein